MPARSDDATATLVRGAASERPIAALVRVEGGAAPGRFVLSRGKCRIGSSSRCEIVIAEPTISRAHAELELVPEGVRVTDLGSHNGTFYLGQRVERITLSLGARFQVAATSIAIDADADSLETVAPFAGDAYRGLVGGSAAMRRLYAMLSRLEGSLATVLVTGESGTGKELVARALHDGSRVSAGPFVAVNCGALPREAIGSELFGHRRGAFTGAVEARRGAFESADGGTLFLDEVGDLPLDLQPVLLRALETGEVRALGADAARRVRVRIVAATHRNLEEAVRAGTFREDLYYRLAVVRLRTPSLRDRPDDIGALARHFAAAHGLADLGPAVVERLKARAFPGNVRELRNVIEAYAALGALPGDEGAAPDDLGRALDRFVDAGRPYAEQKEALVDRFTRAYLERLLAHTGHNLAAAARLAGLDRSYFGRLLAKHGLS